MSTTLRQAQDTAKKRIATFFLLVGLVFLLVLLEVQPALAIPTFQTLSITLDPTSGPPGSQVVVEGEGFGYYLGMSIDLYWDSTSGPRIGSSYVRPDGSFTAMATIPPNARDGTTHTIIAYEGPKIQASATFTVAGDSLQAAFIYGTSRSVADEFKTLLWGDGMLYTDLVPLSDVARTDFSLYDLIIIGYDTGNWGDSAAVTSIRDSRLPILGLGTGGNNFFGELSLHIGHASYFRTRTIRPVDLSHTIYRTPYRFFGTSIQVLISNVASYRRYLPSPPPDVLTLGLAGTLGDNYYSLVQQCGRYFLWGFDGDPADMTTDGQRLFVNVVWYMLGARMLDVDTLILTDYDRMKDIGYSSAEVESLETKITTLVADTPSSESNMTAVVRRLNLDTPWRVQTTRTAWVTGTNVENVTETNDYVTAIDGYIESLKQGLYPRLQYVILVGAHEVIPMKARPSDFSDEKRWAEKFPRGCYLRSLYSAPGVNYWGHYLTDSIYGDLSYVDNGYGADNELLPELAVGRMVETPSQISTLLDNYMASNGSLSQDNMAAIGSHDFLDGAQRAANFMGPSADTTLIQDGFDSNRVPPVINAHNDIVYIGGHGDSNYIQTDGELFCAGHSPSMGDTEELNNIPDAVIVSAGCHTGVNIGNRLCLEYGGNYQQGGADFPERFAIKGVGIYLASTGKTAISGSGDSTNTAEAEYTELLATDFINYLLHYTAAGRAYKYAIDDYVFTHGGDYSGTPEHRQMLASATLYGIPNYGWPGYEGLLWRQFQFQMFRQWRVWPPASTAQEEVTLEITDWSVEPSGLIDIPGVSYTSEDGEPILPIVHASRVLPADSKVVKITWNQAESESTTIVNDVPLATMGLGGLSAPYPNNPNSNAFSYDGFYPPTPYYSTTVSTLGGGGVKAGLTIVPVQYNPSTHKTRIWTKMAFDVEYEVDKYALGRHSDGDGLPDYWESSYGLNPNDPDGDQGASGDPDGDRLTNEEEYDLGTNPIDPDTDHDGSNDGQEVDNGTDPLNPGSRCKSYEGEGF